MKYKILLTGKNDSAIDDFFMQMSDNFEVMTTSSRFEDIIRHMTYFQPNVFAYCLHNESREDMIQVANFKFRLSKENIPLVIIGLKEDCDEFEKIAINVSNLTLYRPMSIGVMQEKIIALLKERRFLKAIGMEAEEDPIINGSSVEQAEYKIPEAVVQSVSPEQLIVSDDEAASVIPGAGGRKRKHILVVDDNAMMLKVLKEHLHEKYDVATAVSGKVALRFLERKKTDLILLDYEMPDESGPAVLEKIRALDATKDLPVIFLTGVTDTKKIKEALALKPQSYLLKPIDRDKLLDAIAKTIG